MAQFTSLFHVGEALAHFVRARLGLDFGQVLVGPPRDEVLDTTRHLRITLLWTNPQGNHRNDVPERNPDGTRVPPPLSLTAHYLFTTYGNTVSEESVGAHELLGDVMRVLHDEPRLSLPLADLAGRGEGKLDVTLVPLAPELVEKLFGPLQLKHRTFALYEVGPVQLKSLKEMLAARPVVLPGGVRLAEPTPLRSRPVLRRVVPSAQAAGGRVRLEGSFPTQPTHVQVGTRTFEGADLQVLAAERAVSVVLPADLSPGIHAVSLSAGKLSAEALPLEVQAAGEATLDAPSALTHSQSADLVLSGQGLADAVEVVAWPDTAVQAPSEVVKLPLAAPATATQLTVAAASLAGLSRRTYRLTVRVGAHRFTPPIVLEVVS